MALSAAEATQIAAKYYNQISNEMVSLTVEEIEKDEQSNSWLITLGIAEQSFSINPVKSKDYKIFKIDIDTKEVLSMKIRKV